MREEQVGERIMESAGTLSEHVAALGHLNRAALQSTMAARTANRFSEQFENLQAARIDATNFFASLAQFHGSVSDTAVALLDMLADRAFAQGAITKSARRYTHELMKKPDFMTGFLADCPDESARKTKLRDLERRIVASGLD